MDYTTTIETLKLRLPYEMDELVKAVTVMIEDLEKYIDENEINQAFFM